MPEHFNLVLLGDPVAHSRSPAIHRAALAESGLEGDYVAIRADQSRLRQAIGDLHSGSLAGCNVTMPLKQEAFALCDRLTAEAETGKSVNSLRMRGGRIEGHSTDVVACQELLGEEPLGGFETVLVLGSGGAARAAMAGMGDREVFVMARDRNKAHALGAGDVLDWGTPVSGALVVNATPLGMGGEPLPESIMSVAGGLLDLPYGEITTPGVLEARRRRLPNVDGIEFLARQARAAFRWWTGRDVELSVLVEAARNV